MSYGGDRKCIISPLDLLPNNSVCGKTVEGELCIASKAGCLVTTVETEEVHLGFIVVFVETLLTFEIFHDKNISKPKPSNFEKVM